MNGLRRSQPSHRGPSFHRGRGPGRPIVHQRRQSADRAPGRQTLRRGNRKVAQDDESPFLDAPSGRRRMRLLWPLGTQGCTHRRLLAGLRPSGNQGRCPLRSCVALANDMRAHRGYNGSSSVRPDGASRNGLSSSCATLRFRVRSLWRPGEPDSADWRALDAQWVDLGHDRVEEGPRCDG